MRILEATVFLTLAGGLHLAALTLSDLPGGGGSGGASGTDSITLQAAPDSLSALAAQWDRPPQVAEAPEQAALPDEDLPVPPVAEESRPKRSAPPPPPTASEAHSAPMVDTRPPAPATLDMTAPSVPMPPAPPEVAPPLTSAADRPVRQAPPSAPSADTAPEAPSVDTTPPAFAGLAPKESLRPTDRPANTTTKEKAPSAAAAPSAPRAAQRATGAGNSGGTARMQAPAKPRPGPSAAQIRSAQAQWGGAIRQSVARAQRYPRGTTARGIVTLRISVSPSGNLAGASVTGSSGTAALDRAALQAARSARLPRAPEALTDASYSFNLPLQFARR